jgi:hypothetical protein
MHKKILRRNKMKKTTITALFYTLLTPINVWTGYELGTENYKLALPLVIIGMIMEFFCVKYWFEAQTEEITNVKYTHQDSIIKMGSRGEQSPTLQG